MAVYVDKARWPYRGKLYCHMIADSDDELERFARCLGLRPEWKDKEHYDLAPSKRRTALKLGAVELAARPFIEKWRPLREAWRKNHETNSRMKTNNLVSSSRSNNYEQMYNELHDEIMEALAEALGVEPQQVDPSPNVLGHLIRQLGKELTAYKSTSQKLSDALCRLGSSFEKLQKSHQELLETGYRVIANLSM